MLRDVCNRNENAQRRCRKKAVEGGGIIRLFEGGITFLAIFPATISIDGKNEGR